MNRTPSGKDPDHRVSVIIPAANAAATVGEAIESALAQEQPAVIEVVVASADEATSRAVRAFDDERVIVVPNPGGKTPAGLNRALAASTGDVVVRCDAHAILPPGYVARALASLDRPNVVNVGGRQVPEGHSTFERAVGMAMVSRIGAGDARYRIGGRSGPVDTVYLGVFQRRALEAVGGFDETLDRNQDYELNWRLRRAGGVVWFDNSLAVGYRPRSNVTALWRQYFQYGRWKRLVLRRHPESRRWRQLAPPALVAGLGLSALLLPFDRRSAAVIPLAYLTVTGAAGVTDLVRYRDGAALTEPLALWVMHLAWGLGFIVGPPAGRN